MTDAADRPKELLLHGLDGANPLAFLAALGTLRILTMAFANECPTMRWLPQASSWRPAVSVARKNGALTEEQVVASIMKVLSSDFDAHPCHLWQNVLTFELVQRRELARSLMHKRELAEWLGGIGINTWSENDIDTQLRATRQDYHVGNLRSVIERTQTSHIHRTLFSIWDYADPLANQSLHLDPSEDRRHAYQWSKPTSDPARHRRGNMLGANRLAIEALPLIPSAPGRGGLETVGFRGRRSADTFWRWPIWDVPLSVCTIGSVLAIADLHADSPAVFRLRPRGVACVYESQRILVQKTPNFTPARAVMT